MCSGSTDASRSDIYFGYLLQAYHVGSRRLLNWIPKSGRDVIAMNLAMEKQVHIPKNLKKKYWAIQIKERIMQATGEDEDPSGAS